MNILVLSKRQYMGKDLLDDHFGRFFEIPKWLASEGHNVAGFCLSYRDRDEQLPDDNANVHTPVKWYSINLGTIIPFGIYRYLNELDRIIESFRPDILYGCSDSIHTILTSIAAKRHNIKYVIDLYDNFESYGATKIPGVTHNFRRSLKQANGISVVSNRLHQYIVKHYNLKQSILLLGNAVNNELFKPRNMASCRADLGLPENATLIGTAGALYRNRDIQTLYDAFRELCNVDDNIHLILAGPRDKKTPLPGGNRVHDLGILEHQRIPSVYSALNLGVICNEDSEFGRYCYPQKFFEILACGTPVIAASVGELQDMLAGHPYALYQPNNVGSLVTGIKRQLNNPEQPHLHIPSWKERTVELGSFFYDIAQTTNP